MLAHYAQDYPALVENLLSVLPEEEAMARAVGSERDSFFRFGALQRRILEQAGFQPGHEIVDVGCGSGRLASALFDDHQGTYVGFDIVPKLVEYAKGKFGRENFHFFTCEGLEIPLDAECADFITFFSVFTHLTHEETFLYLEEARRVLRPGGTIVCSYLDMEQNWETFKMSVETRRTDTADHANVFMSREIVERLVTGAGFEIASISRPDDGSVHFPVAVELPGEPTMPAGVHRLGQGVCIARKPG
jgi:2-polyprenyl-3-methyl-5-hydroxy-6-metoxy-1,4-benzoquinol methylase